MYRDAYGSRLALYVSNEIGDLGSAPGTSPGTPVNTTASTPTGANKDTAFRFAREGKINVFYWVEGPSATRSRPMPTAPRWLGSRPRCIDS